MFCQNCGAQIPDNAKFCGSCGTVNALYKPETTEPAQAAVNSSAVPQQVSQTIPQTIPQEIPAPAFNAAETQSFQQPAQPAQPAQNTQAASGIQYAQNIPQEQPAQGVQNPTDMLMNEYYRAANAQNNTIPTGTVQQPAADPQPMRYTAAPVADMPVKKKKSKLIPGLCIAAGAVVVLGGAGAAIYHFNKASINRMIMGDANYAYSLVASSFSGLAQQSELLNTAVQTTFTSSELSGNSVGEILESTMDGSYGEILEPSMDGSFGEISSSVTSDPMAAMGNALEFGAAYINELTGTNGVTVSLSGSVQLDQSVIDMAKSSVYGNEEAEQMIEDLLGNLDDIKLSMAEKDSGSAYEYNVKLSAGKDSIVEAQVRYEEDGTLTMVFPEMSDIGITAQLPEHSWEDVKKDTPVVNFDFNKLYTKIGAELKKSFEELEIECGNDTVELGNLKFSGMTVEINLDCDDVCDLCQVVVDVVSEDKEFADYLKSLDDSMDDDDIENMFDELSDGIDEMRNSSTEFDIKLTYYVNNDNSIAGFAVSAESNGSEVKIDALCGGNNAEVSASANGEEYFAIHVEGTSDNSGRAEVVFGGADSLYSSGVMNIDGIDSGRYSFYIDYKDVGKTAVFGIPTEVGSYTISLSSSTAAALSGGNSELQKVLKNSSITLSAATAGKGIAYTLGADIAGYGKGELTMALEETTGEVAPKPGSNYKLVDPNTASNEDGEQLGNDFLEYFEKLADKNKLVGAIYKIMAISSSSNQVIEYPDYIYDDYGNNYDDYNSNFDDYISTPLDEAVIDAKITSADSTASAIKIQTITFFTKMDAARETLNNFDRSGEILRFYVYSGTWLMDCTTSSRFGEDDKATWCFGSDENWDYCKYMAYALPDFEYGLVEVAIIDGNCVGVAVIEGDAYSYPGTSMSDWYSGSFDFTGTKQGLMSDGTIIGTSPKLYWNEL